jgi:hypothetical protein
VTAIRHFDTEHHNVADFRYPRNFGVFEGRHERGRMDQRRLGPRQERISE